MNDEELREYRWSLLASNETPEAAYSTDKWEEVEREEERRSGIHYSSINYLRRKVLLSGGKHTKGEIEEILDLQGHRCIYCNVLFTDKKTPTRDHIKPVAMRGSDWALNIVMACRICNASRGKRHFLAFYESLNRTQRKRILKHLNRRIEVVSLLMVPDTARKRMFSNLKQLAADCEESLNKKTSHKKPAPEKTRTSASGTGRTRMTAAERKERLSAIFKAAK